jgi:hypothetical protein
MPELLDIYLIKKKEEKKDLQRLLLMVSEQTHIHEFNNHQSFCIFQIHVYGNLVHIQVHGIWGCCNPYLFFFVVVVFFFWFFSHFLFYFLLIPRTSKMLECA